MTGRVEWFKAFLADSGEQSLQMAGMVLGQMALPVLQIVKAGAAVEEH